MSNTLNNSTLVIVIDESAGVDCVDWPPMFAFMQDRRLDPVELDFEF